MPAKGLYTVLWQPVSNSRLVLFRMLFGIVMAGECINSIISGRVTNLFVNSEYNFTFIGFEWLNILHGKIMYGYYGLMGLLGLLVAAGLFYRFSAASLALMWTASYLSNKVQYNNHYYLMVLLAWLLCTIPAHRRCSVDVRLGLTAPSASCYAWQVNIFIFQIACMYFFSAIAKLNSDWLHAIPLTQWLHHKTGTPLIGWTFRNPITPYLVACGGLFFDLFIVPGLLYKPTRKLFLFFSVMFHTFNGYVFTIGTFPFLALTLNIFFFPSAADKLLSRYPTSDFRPLSSDFQATTPNLKLQTLLILYAAIQLFLPLRHLFISGDVSWTEEGHRMSWRMMLRSKTGICYFRVVDKASRETRIVEPASVFDSTQLTAIATLPDVTLQAAQYLKQKYSTEGNDVAIYAHTSVSLNFRPARPLIDTTTDLANVQWKHWGHNTWITSAN